jgi:adenylyltransferase/sulfurtransferase
MHNLPIEIDCLSTEALLEANDKPFLLLDCREPDEHATVRIEGAVLLPMSELAVRHHELEPHRGKRIVVYCHHGGRSLGVVRWLREQGFADSQSMAGGIDRWALEVEPGLPRY